MTSTRSASPQLHWVAYSDSADVLATAARYYSTTELALVLEDEDAHTPQMHAHISHCL